MFPFLNVRKQLHIELKKKKKKAIFLGMGRGLSEQWDLSSL